MVPIKSLLMILVGLMALLPAGCGDPKKPEVVLAVGGSPAELRVWERIVEEFTAATQIPVRLLRQPSDSSQRRQGLLVALKSRQADPDVFLMDVAWLGLFAASGWLQPFASKDMVPFFSSIVRQVDLHQGRPVALPVFVDVGVLYYRSDLLDGPPPRTWCELARRASRIQASMRREVPDFWGFVWQGAQYEGLVVNFLDFAGRQGGFIVKNGRLVVDTEQNERALTHMRDYIHGRRISPPNTFTEMQEETVRLAFHSGKALFARNWPYALNLHRSEGSPVRDKTALSALPAPAGGQAAPTLGGWHVGVSVYSDVGEKAQRLARYITGAKVQKTLALELGLLPARRQLYGDRDILERSPHFKRLPPLLAAARPRPVIATYSLVSQIMQRHLSDALSGSRPPNLALARAQREIDSLLQRFPIQNDSSCAVGF